MIAVDQTFVGNDEGGRVPGNCTQAAIASLLELDLNLVPHFALFDVYWKYAITAWLTSRGKRLRVYTDREDAVEDWGRLDVSAGDLNRAPSDQMLIATGQSFSGPWRHVVLWKSAALVHDPNPARLGIDGPPIELWQITDVS